MTVTIAELDNNKVLFGFKIVNEAKDLDVVVPDNCDLPTDFKYKWNGTSFVPLGSGSPRPKSAPISMHFAVYKLMEAVKVQGTKLSAETKLWMKYYEENLLRTEEEYYLKGGKK